MIKITGKRKYNFNKEELEELYFGKKLRQWEIANIYGCDQGTISHQFKKFGLNAEYREFYHITPNKQKKFVISRYRDNYFGRERFVIEVSTLKLKLKEQLLMICKTYFNNCYTRMRNTHNKRQTERFVILLRDFNSFPDHFYDSLKNDLERGV